GAKIEGAGTPTITIEGVRRLKGVEYEVIPDRIEAATFMIAAAMTSGDVTIKGANFAHLQAVTARLREAGHKVTVKAGNIRVRGGSSAKPVEIVTQPYPGFPTDIQAQFMTLASLTPGASVIQEKVYPDRFMHVGELQRLGADISMDSNTAIVRGVKKLSGAQVMASDLRASAALVLAGLVADGETTVNRVYHIDRGYEDIEVKLSKLGARIKRVKSN
ncbi:MAG: UDP-N-acetylglucosamine 1-carboxyvinyltransferase, partial [Thermoplasmata archaeon]|nr:UDP-N-acetylglucosamine 1-carboxyvinyltransferase [Thermoplasmata archaeon]